MITMLDNISNSLRKEYIEFDKYNQHVRCLAHIINLAAKNALKILENDDNNNIDNNNNSDNENNDDKNKNNKNIIQKVNIYNFL
jgi:hypothetical protein